MEEMQAQQQQVGLRATYQPTYQLSACCLLFNKPSKVTTKTPCHLHYYAIIVCIADIGVLNFSQMACQKLRCLWLINSNSDSCSETNHLSHTWKLMVLTLFELAISYIFQ
ncbi:hypothetical protein M5D96_005382 [Drosophila gunungcola]|uniref:Uncharacterized protein n=1 Tax=Drosophila gunungcola TaxID=103775 RepID=A0A9P9YQP0_9MUSC|nr:hypothetical protein M5D96_005382 [Drosophila gunungcola]